MGSLLSDSEKNNLSSIVSENLFDTFKSTILVWKKPEITVISTSSDYNFIMGDFEKEEIENVPVSTSFDAVVQYLKPQEAQSFLEGKAKLDERFNFNKIVVRIKCKEDCFNYLKDSLVIELDSRKFKIASGVKQYGLFSRSLYMLMLEEII